MFYKVKAVFIIIIRFFDVDICANEAKATMDNILATLGQLNGIKSVPEGNAFYKVI